MDVSPLAAAQSLQGRGISSMDSSVLGLFNNVKHCEQLKKRALVVLPRFRQTEVVQASRAGRKAAYLKAQLPKY